MVNGIIPIIKFKRGPGDYPNNGPPKLPRKLLRTFLDKLTIP